MYFASVEEGEIKGYAYSLDYSHHKKNRLRKHSPGPNAASEMPKSARKTSIYHQFVASPSMLPVTNINSSSPPTGSKLGGLTHRCNNPPPASAMKLVAGTEY